MREMDFGKEFLKSGERVVRPNLRELGLPDLDVFKNDMRAIQDNYLRMFIETRLRFRDEGVWKNIKLIPQQVEFIGDLFWGRPNARGEPTRCAIVWKDRGGGGSLCAAVLLWLDLVYHSLSWLDMAGSGEQAKQVYDYTVDFWDCVPKAKNALLKEQPLISKTELSDGTFLRCIPNSQTQARGKHPNGLLCDEACQDDEARDRNLRAAIQSVLCRENYKVILMSSFHVPVCMFQDYWDNAEERDFTRYYWNIYDVMQPCEAPVPCESCELTVQEEHQGRKVLSGCAGRARASKGFLPRANAIAAKRINSVEDFAVEHECKRPKTEGPVYDGDLIDVAWRTAIPKGDAERPVIGIDWGYGVTAVIGPIYRAEGLVAVAGEKYFSGRPVSSIVEHLKFIQAQVGKKIRIMADAENAFANLDVENAGFDVEPIAFGKWKEFGVSNIEKYLESRRLAVANAEKLGTVMKKMRRDKRGTVVKTRDDHGHDGLLCGLLGFIWLNEFASELEVIQEQETESSCQLI